MAEFRVKIDAMWTNDGTFEQFAKKNKESSDGDEDEDDDNEDLMSEEDE